MDEFYQYMVTQTYKLKLIIQYTFTESQIKFHIIKNMQNICIITGILTQTNNIYI